MENIFSLRSHVGEFDVTPDPDAQVVYVENHHKKNAPQILPVDIPSWCFDPQTIWFYFQAPETEDKVSAGEKIKSQLLEEIENV
jgi:hypothetical protein